jgi:CRP-like cAMP-binding protein
VKLTVTSQQGKVAIFGVLNVGSFLGEGCIAGQALRAMTATAITDCALLKIEKATMMALLHEREDLSRAFVSHVLSRNVRYEIDLVDQLFNSGEGRLARILLLLARYGKKGEPKHIEPKISHETLAQMVGTSRPHIVRFMKKFEQLGFIEYKKGLIVHNSLIDATLHY